jgi:hypothetical protein
MRRWQIVISFVGIVGGIFTAFGVLVLFQQAGMIYPTRNVGILTIVLGALWGIAVPSLTRSMALRRAYPKPS